MYIILKNLGTSKGVSIFQTFNNLKRIKLSYNSELYDNRNKEDSKIYHEIYSQIINLIIESMISLT
jgi:hypothetical protein